MAKLACYGNATGRLGERWQNEVEIWVVVWWRFLGMVLVWYAKSQVIENKSQDEMRRDETKKHGLP